MSNACTFGGPFGSYTKPGGLRYTEYYIEELKAKVYSTYMLL